MSRVFCWFLGLVFSLMCYGCSSIGEYDALISKSNLCFSEDFESGGFDRIQVEKARANSATIIEDSSNKENHILKIVLEHGDIVHNGNRCEIKTTVGERVGDELIYKISFMLDEGYSDSEKRQSLFQLHDQPDYGHGETWEEYSLNPTYPPFILNYIDGELSIVTGGEEVEMDPVRIEKGRWYELAVHVLYEYNNEGFVEVFLDGVNISGGKVYCQIIYNDSTNYAKAGLYRSREILEQGIVYYDDFEIYKVKNK